MIYIKDGVEQTIDLTADDLVFITNGCCTDTSCYGDQNTVPDLSCVKNGTGESWDLWKNIAAQADHGEYGNPDHYCDDFEATNWMSATVATANEDIIQHIMKICKRDPRKGKLQPAVLLRLRIVQKIGTCLGPLIVSRSLRLRIKILYCLVYGLTTNKEGNFVKKAMRVAPVRKFVRNGSIISVCLLIKLKI